jgi:predicted dehydrogenase
MKDGKIIVGIMGLQFGLRHLAGAIENGYEIGAICDPLPGRVQKYGKEYNIPEDRWYNDYKDCLNIGLDVVVLAVPDQLHRQMAEEFLAAGVNVLCEKPLALNRDDLVAIIKAEKANKARFMVGQVCRFTPAFIKAKEIIDAGTIGDIYFIESEYAHDYMRIVSNEKGWRADPARHGAIGGGCHAVDLMRWIAGDPYEITAYGTHKLLPSVPYNDATIAIMKFPDNVIGKVFVSTGCKRNYTMRTVIYGTKGTIICDNTSDHLTLFTVDETGWTKDEAEEIPVGVNNHNVKGEIAVFVDAILNNKPIMMTAEEGARSAQACLSIVESSDTGKIVYPDYNFN